MNKNFIGQTVVNGCKPRGNTYQKVTLEDPEFDKKYKVFSTDQVEARYLLTTSFMERFKNIRTTFKANGIKCSFKNGELLIAICTNKDLFSIGSLIKPVTDPHQFQELLDEFVSILELVDTLKLDMKIGL